MKDKLGKFWVVTYPTFDSELGDILFQADINRMYLQFLGGLTIKMIAGVYKRKKEAEEHAKKLLKQKKLRGYRWT